MGSSKNTLFLKDRTSSLVYITTESQAQRKWSEAQDTQPNVAYPRCDNKGAYKGVILTLLPHQNVHFVTVAERLSAEFPQAHFDSGTRVGCRLKDVSLTSEDEISCIVLGVKSIVL